MKAPAFCTLTDDGFAAQRERFLRVKPAVERVESSPGSVRVVFAPGFDAELAREMVEVERECCSFLTLELADRTLTISSSDPEQWHVVEGFAKVFSGVGSTEPPMSGGGGLAAAGSGK